MKHRCIQLFINSISINLIRQLGRVLRKILLERFPALKDSSPMILFTGGRTGTQDEEKTVCGKVFFQMQRSRRNSTDTVEIFYKHNFRRLNNTFHLCRQSTVHLIKIDMISYFSPHSPVNEFPKAYSELAEISCANISFNICF